MCAIFTEEKESENPNDTDLKAKQDKEMLRFDEHAKSGETHEEIQLSSWQNYDGVFPWVTNVRFVRLFRFFICAVFRRIFHENM